MVALSSFLACFDWRAFIGDPTNGIFFLLARGPIDDFARVRQRPALTSSRWEISGL